MTVEPTFPLRHGDRIGIIGGGQLGRMLAFAAQRLGFRVTVLDPDPASPAALVADDVIIGAYDDRAALGELASRADVVTYEFENVPVAPLAVIPAAKLAPGTLALETAQDRLTEKAFFNQLGIATAPYADIASEADLDAAFRRIGPGILKTRRMGYDGKGQVRLRAADDIGPAFAAMAGAPAIHEGLVTFVSEISVIGVRGRDGAFAAYEPGENVHRDGILATTTVPAQASPASRDAAIEATRRVADALGYVGVIGVEFFVLADGSLIANEFAPRVHNSGHWTEAACAIPQFEAHVRAIAGWPVPPAARHSDCVMENLIGDDIARLAVLARDPAVVLHHYGKAEIRPGRKMGHATRLLRPADHARG